MNRTAIEWVKNPDGSRGYTWNPITGCLNHVNGMCKGGNFPCYAYWLAHTRLRERYLANRNTSTDKVMWEHPAYTYDDPFYPRFWEDRLSDGIFNLGKKAKGIFVCDMSDLFGIGVPYEWQHKIMSVIKMDGYQQHRFYLLTKQPQNLIKFSPFPDDCWVGVTITTQDHFNNAYHLARIRAKVRFLSIEPLLEHIDISSAMAASEEKPYQPFINHIDWVIIGAQTKPYKPPKIEWVREIVEACDKAGVKVFLKENLRPLFENYGAPLDFYHKGYLRQEMPTVI